MVEIERIAIERSNTYRIYLSTKESFLISEDTLVAFTLSKGMEISEDELKEILSFANFDTAYQQALNYLSYQLRTEKEIDKYLQKKEFGKPIRNQVNQKLKELKLIDDLVYAESYTRTQIKLGTKGPRVIKNSLKERGVAETTIDKAIELYTSEDEEAIATQLFKKNIKRFEKKSFTEAKQKSEQHLMTKGFSRDIIKIVLDTSTMEKNEETEFENLKNQGDKLWKKNSRFDKDKQKEKVKMSLFRKGFSYDGIQLYLSQKEESSNDE